MENANNRLIVALDSKEILESKSLVSKLKTKVSFYKIGLRTFVIDGFNLVDEIKEYGKKVFLDLKLYDIKSTIQETVARISEHNIDFLTVNGDPSVVRAALDGNKVLLVERFEYPKDKICGDAVGGKSLRHVEELGIYKELSSTPHFEFNSVVFSSPSGDEFKVQLPDDHLAGYVYPRQQFDWLLFNRAVDLVLANGGAVIQNLRVNEILYKNVDGGEDPGNNSKDQRHVS